MTKVNLMKNNFLVLNIDKTIFDVVDPIHQAYKNLARRYDLDVPVVFLERVLDTRGSSRERLDRQFFRLARLHPQAAELSALYIAQAIADDKVLADQAEAFLRFLDEQAIPYGAVSSLPRSFVTQMTAKYPLFHPAFSIVQSEVFEGKPEPDLYLMAARKAGVHPTQILAIENTHLGAESAFLANAKSIFMADESNPENPETSYSLHTVGNLDELALVLENMLKAD
jgi:sugar-phosphatase